MIDFARLDPEILRDIDLELLDNPRQEYVAVDAELDDPKILRRCIMDVPVSALGRFLHRLGSGWVSEPCGPRALADATTTGKRHLKWVQ